jgi:hypothetical protein
VPRAPSPIPIPIADARVSSRHEVSTDGARLEVWWSRLTAIVDEAASAMLRTAFSTIIRESNDYTVVLMNSSGERIADCRVGIPAFSVLIGSLTCELLTRFPADTWREGECVITSDPWIGTGHLPDMAMVTPIFHGGTLVGFAGTAAHLPDIGGNPSMGPTEPGVHAGCSARPLARDGAPPSSRQPTTRSGSQPRRGADRPLPGPWRHRSPVRRRARQDGCPSPCFAAPRPPSRPARLAPRSSLPLARGRRGPRQPLAACSAACSPPR